ncbi:hypothetical protein AXE65_07850 [Ventosimonas gracilis]|uniref:Translocation and assembly module subunit TamA n=1 Tax=Ventosimonas gracilis TaxID=1680762 RepID=A0A139SHD8_9GAMM|nr:autotransporter assembly complex family protein [Ventosimonas gracilis]KXU33931.1 hypothetical protein AXE65_07850 [Ventosimonas gracilis]
MNFFLKVALILLAGALSLAQAQESLEIKIEPADATLKANVEGTIGPLAGRDATALAQLAPSSAKQARAALEALGYYEAQVKTQVLLGKGKQPARLLIEIRPGEPVRLRKVAIEISGEASQLADFYRLDDPLLQVGAVLNHGAYESAKQAIERGAQRYGFFRGAFVRQQLIIDPKARAADIALIYDSGPRYRLGRVIFPPLKPMSDDFLQRLVPFAPDTPYDAQKIADLYQALQNSDYFTNVQIDAQPVAGTEQVPVKVKASLRKARNFSIGAGFSTDVGVRARFGWTHHYSGSNAHRYGLKSELAQPKQNLSFWYEIPLAAPLSDKLRFAGGYQNEEIAGSDSSSRLYKLSSRLGQKLESGWQRTLSLTWQHEAYRRGDKTGISNLLMPGISFNLQKMDNSVDPSNGYRLQFDMAAAKKDFLSDANLLHANLLMKGLYSFWDRHRLLARLQMGGTATNDYTSIPSSLRYYAGGDQSVRGYDYQSLAPKNDKGKRVGGRYLMTNSLEYQYRFAEKWRVAAFVDQGNAFDHLEIPSLKTGVGLGLRWISPLGPLRLDLAHAMDGDKGFRLHFSMGPEL